MESLAKNLVPRLIEARGDHLLEDWLRLQRGAGALRGGQISESELVDQSRRFLAAFRHGVESGELDDASGPGWSDARSMLDELSGSRATLGFTPSETAIFVFSLKEPLFALLTAELAGKADAIQEIWVVSRLLDKLGLFTTEVHQRRREEVIIRQQEELLELSTPVIQLWQGVLALPLIGTLDSSRTQIVMQTLLEQIVASGAEIAIIDITGVPTVDTLVAQHLIKTVSAARLMGADCILSGIRPAIAQTIVHLGLELGIVSKATMADAFALALRRLGKAVANRSPMIARMEKENDDG
ncbi:MAG TPA: STAS domain-containing protein [Stellaceae bacterium]|nr:STAS domain-containing protein [Stellaceae bacterium]